MDITLLESEEILRLTPSHGSAGEPFVLDGGRYTFPRNWVAMPSSIGGRFRLEGDTLRSGVSMTGRIINARGAE